MKYMLQTTPDRNPTHRGKYEGGVKVFGGRYLIAIAGVGLGTQAAVANLTPNLRHAMMSPVPRNVCAIQQTYEAGEARIEVGAVRGHHNEILNIDRLILMIPQGLKEEYLI